MREHILYNTEDSDKPREICDRNGEVTLGLCRVCGQGEADLEPECPGPKIKIAWYPGETKTQDTEKNIYKVHD
jgi:hypothetical protein